ncbi:MAG: hydroxyacylglutathione hydrolase, partial [Gammaproteobacteria bacterium]
HTAIVIDPGDAKPVVTFLQQQQLQLNAILITHHHWDHSGGVAELKHHYDVPVYGKTRETVADITHPVAENDTIKLDNLTLDVIEIPGHTLDHIAYYAPGMLFCGDTLFSAGCGRVFEGTTAQMYASLQKIAALPDDTAIYCGHEYTLNNLLFAQTVEPDNAPLAQKLAQVRQLRHENKSTLPSLLEAEKTFNPFLRCDKSSVIAAAEKYSHTSLNDPIDVFSVIRNWKNNFK